VISKFAKLGSIKHYSRIMIRFALASGFLGLALLAPNARGQAASTGSAASAATASSAPAASATSATPANAAPLFTAEARTAADSDPVLQAMLAEIERSKEHLKMDGVQAPYFIEYRLVDIGGEAASAVFGALESDQHSRARILRVTVRIGDYKQDSYFRNGIGVADFAPYENDILALRQQLWNATDRAYKAAGEAYAAKLSLAKQITMEHSTNDFAAATPLISVEPVAKVDLDTAKWKKAIADASALYAKYPDVQSVSALLRFASENIYLVNTEGTVARRGWTQYFVSTYASTQADDGMRLARSPFVLVSDADELPAPEKFVTDADATLESLKQLRLAPIVDEEYRGPVLFDADAADDVFAELVGNNVDGPKPDPGASARTTGDFASSYKSRVLPDFITIVDDPTQKSFQGHSLLGSYSFDEEGVKAAAVTVVANGTLTNYLIGRAPIRDFPSSNGHGRAAPGGPATPNIGNLFLQSTKTMPLADLKKKLIAMCQDEGKPYGYYVQTLGDELSPRLLYRVWVKDGKEELVRGAVFNELDTRELRNDLILTGDAPLVRNREGNVPTTVIAPAMLFDELEVKRADATKDTLPDYPPPPIAGAR
jgi:predicted Zn-dependent protease